MLAKSAQQRLQKRQRKQVNDPNEGLLDFQLRVSPKFTRPEHYATDVVPILERALTEPVRLLLSAPPRHGKTELIAHLIAMYLARYPDRTVAYISYAADLSEEKSRRIREYCMRAGVEMSPHVRAASGWKTLHGGGLDAVGIGGALTGKGYNLIVIDDPFKNRQTAESIIERANIFEFCTSTALTRLEPGGSVIVTHTRWHPQDLIGVLKDNQAEGWVYINKPAINDGSDPLRETGAALWPDRWPVHELVKVKARNEYDWSSLYMGQPRPKGGAVFRGTTLYSELPKDPISHLKLTPKRSAIGLDLAYTAKTYADYSVCVTALQFGDEIYITNVRRKQCDATEFAIELRTERLLNPGAMFYWFIGGIEKGIVSLLKNMGIHVHAEPAKTDKFVRAQAVAAAWNAGKVKVPVDGEWVSDFLAEVLTFTGVADTHDDQVDALAAAFEPLGAKTLPRGGPRKRIVPFS